MSKLGDKTALVFDSVGIFPSLAMKISNVFNEDGYGRVLYHAPTDEDNPSVRQVCWGQGFERFGFDPCDDPFIPEIFDSIDTWIFPHNGYMGIQLLLEKLGKNVVGSKKGMELELYRRRFRKLQRKLGMDVPEHVIKDGVSALASHLAALENKWLKIDRFRGDMETKKWRNWELDEGLLDHLAVRFGAFKEDVPFMVEDNIETEIEDGGDFFTVDGQIASHCVIGVEKKNIAYLAFLRKYEELDQQIKEAIEPLLPTLKGLRYRNSISTEQRKTKTDNFLTDITTRWGFPSGNCQMDLYGNLPLLLDAASQGELIPIEPAGQVCIELILHHDDSPEEFRTMRVPDAVFPWLNPLDCCLKDNMLVFTPSNDRSDVVGSISGMGDDIESAYDHLKDNLEMIKGQPVHYGDDAIEDLIEEVKLAQKQGIEFTEEKLPDGAEMLNGE